MNDAEFNPYAPPQANLTPQGDTDELAKHLEGIEFPLLLRFRVLTFAPRIDVTDANGRSVFHARQKLFRFREHVEIFSDSTRKTKLGEIRANKIIDWSARYNFTDAWGGEIGSVGRKGWRSLWRAHYEAFNPGDSQPDFTIREENPFAKFMDGLVGQIPILGLLTVWLFNPRYLAARTDGSPSLRVTKKPAFLEGRFSVEQAGPATPREVMNLLLSFVMLALLERKRG